jgi:hypothetical protein
MEKLEINMKFLLENLNGRDNFVDLGVDGRTILKLTLKKRRTWTGFIWIRIRDQWLDFMHTVIEFQVT